MKLPSLLGAALGLILTKGLLAQTPSAPAAPPLLAEGDAYIKTWQAPQYPPELKAKGLQGDVTIHFVVDETGVLHNAHAVKSSDPSFEAAAVEAVSKWTFEPAIENSLPVSSGMSTHLLFKLPEPKSHLLPPADSRPKVLPKTPAIAESTPNPEYPRDLVPRRLNAQVLLEIEVDGDGRVSSSTILGATHPDFIKPSLDAVARWKFKPGHQGDLAIKSVKRVPMTFDVYVPSFEDGVPGQLVANGYSIQVPEGTSPATICSSPPELWAAVDPVYPAELALAGKSGEAEVAFTISIQGQPEAITLRSASDPAFGKSLMAAIEASTFKPGILSGAAVAVPMTMKHVFTAPSETAQENEPAETRLIRTLRTGTIIAGAKGLDTKIAPLWHAPPAYPSGLRSEKAAGTADVEGIIDRDGRVRAIHIVAASREELGWAAATALSQWVFNAPKRGGEPVDVRVRVPFKFAP